MTRRADEVSIRTTGQELSGECMPCRLTLDACYPMLHNSVGPPDGALKYGSGFKPVNPAIYRANALEHPQFRVSIERQPPSSAFFHQGELRKFPIPVGAILPNDLWEVRYKFNNFLMVNSLEFDRRQCQRVKRPSNLPIMADGRCGYDWCIYISARGDITGGWDNCPLEGFDKFVFKPDPDAVRLQDWGQQPFFEVVPRTSK